MNRYFNENEVRLVNKKTSNNSLFNLNNEDDSKWDDISQDKIAKLELKNNSDSEVFEDEEEDSQISKSVLRLLKKYNDDLQIYKKKQDMLDIENNIENNNTLTYSKSVSYFNSKLIDNFGFKSINFQADYRNYSIEEGYHST